MNAIDVDKDKDFFIKREQNNLAVSLICVQNTRSLRIVKWPVCSDQRGEIKSNENLRK